MLSVRVESLRWATGALLAVVGAMMLITPHQFGSPVYAALQPALSWWGVGFLVAGAALIASAALAVPAPFAVAAHLLGGAAWLALAYGLALTGGWTGTSNFLVFGLGTACDPLLARLAARRPHAVRADLFALLLGLAGTLTGLIMLTLPGQFASPAYDHIRPYLMWQGLAFLVGGLALIFAQAHPTLPPVLSHPAHLLAGGAFLAFFALSALPLRAWVGIVYYGGFGAVVALLPWLGPRLGRLDPASLHTRLALALAAAAAVSSLTVVALATDQHERATAAEARDHQEKLAAALAEEVAEYVGLHRAVVAALARQPGLLDLTPERQLVLLRAYAAEYPDVLAFATYDAVGRAIARSDGSPSAGGLAGYPVFEQARATGAPTLDVLISPVYRRPVFALGAPVGGSDGRFAGLVTAALESKRLAEALARADVGSAALAYVVDARGRAIAHPDARLVEALADLSPTPPVAALLAGGAERGSLRFPGAGGERLAGYARAPRLGWGVVVEEPTAVALAAARASRDLAFGVLLGAFAVVAILGAYAASWLTAPLRALARATDKLGAGDTTAPLPQSSVRELSQLSDGFGEMRRRLALRTAERDEAARSLRAAYDDLELRVQARTADLAAEVAERRQAQAAVSRLNADLERRAAELAAAVKELEAFSYTVSHDLRAPLRAMDGFSRLLLRDHAAQLSPEAQRYLAMVRENAQQMGRLIDDLLTFSRLSRRPLERQTVTLDVVARQALDDLRAEQAGRSVEARVAPLGEAAIDPALFRQVFVNLLANALKFTRKREVARIEVGCLDGAAERGERSYYVRDNGVGFDMRYAGKLFGVFQRLHRADEYEGTGVGLAIVQRIVHRHGGQVWAEAAVDRGATFYFTLGSAPAETLDATPDGVPEASEGAR